jgi:hypothetical protein
MRETHTCGWCLNLFEREPRDPAQIEALRMALHVLTVPYEPKICDGCYNSVMGSMVQPKNFHASPNVLLRSKYGPLNG